MPDLTNPDTVALIAEALAVCRVEWQNGKGVAVKLAPWHEAIVVMQYVGHVLPEKPSWLVARNATPADLDHALRVWLEWLRENATTAPVVWLFPIVLEWLDGKPIVEALASAVVATKEGCA